MFNLALLLQRNNKHAEAAEYWRRYLASVLKILRNADPFVSVLTQIHSQQRPLSRAIALAPVA